FFVAITTAGSAANGLVSIAWTKIELGFESSAGALLYGRVRRAVHKPDFTKLSCTCARDNPARSLTEYLANSTASSPSTSITNEWNTRWSPRLIATTVPDAGAV